MPPFYVRMVMSVAAADPCALLRTTHKKKKMQIHRSRTSVLLLLAAAAVQLSSNVASDISYNEWSTAFPPAQTSSAFTMILLSAIFDAMIMLPATLVLSAVYCYQYADGIPFLTTLLGRRKMSFILPLLLVTTCDFLINVLGTYALGNVSLLTQVTMKALEPFLALSVTVGLFQNERRRFLKEPRLQWLIPALIFVILGTVVHFVPKFVSGGVDVAGAKGKAWWWDAVWFLRVVASVGYNVGQCACVSTGGTTWRSMRPKEEVDDLDAEEEEGACHDEAAAGRGGGDPREELHDGFLVDAVPSNGEDPSTNAALLAPVSGDRVPGDPVVSPAAATAKQEMMAMQMVRMWTLSLDLFLSMLLTVAIVPSLDASPTFSGHSYNEVSTAWQRFDQGTACVLRPWSVATDDSNGGGSGGSNLTTVPPQQQHYSQYHYSNCLIAHSDDQYYYDYL